MNIPAEIQVIVVGAGQAGIAASEHLRSHKLDHIVLERDSIAESWKSRRWDSLVANGPAWHDKFPNLKFDGNQNRFVDKESVASYMERYSKQIEMPVFTGVSVTNVTSQPMGFIVETDANINIKCMHVIVATGAFQIPLIPSLIPSTMPVQQIHSIDYKNPSQISDGNILVVGAGSSGAQIADELCSHGSNRKVYLSVGPHDRPPRSYRNRDFCWWLGVLNKWDMEALPDSDHTTIAVSGANGGKTMDFRKLAHRGVVLVGKTNGFENGKLLFSDDLKNNIASGDANYLSLLDEADAYIAKTGIDLPLEPNAREFPPDPECLETPIKELDLFEANITNIIWATGFKTDYQWLSGTNAVSKTGAPSHKRGISSEPGIYFLGLPWQTRRGSSFIWGVWYDAKYVADHIAKQNMYLEYDQLD